MHNQIEPRDRIALAPIVPLLICVSLLLVFLFERPLTIIVQKIFSTSVPYTMSKAEGENIYHFAVDKKYADKINYFRVSFRFKLNKTPELDNLFQTADVNSGIRAEMGGPALGLVLPESSDATKLKGFALSDAIEVGRWYDFSLSAIRGSSLSAAIDGRHVLSALDYRPNFRVNNIVVGSGFSLTRPFGGAIADVHVNLGSAPSRNTALLIILALKAILVGAVLVSVRYARWPAVAAAPRGPAVRRAYDPLLVLRAIACALVVVGHGIMIAFRPADFQQMVQQNGLSGILSASPWGGVWVFFTLSGYLMGKAFFLERYPLSHEGIFAFYRNRVLRIVPIYWVSILFVFAFELPGVFLGENFPSVIRILLLDNDGELDINPIGALWSICTEMQFYMLAPLIFFQISKITSVPRNVVLCLIAIVAFGLAFRFGSIEVFGWGLWHREVYKTLIGNIDLFMMGFMLNVLLSGRLGTGTYFAAFAGYVVLALAVAVMSWISAQGMVIEKPFWHAFLFQATPTLVALCVCAVIFLFEVSPAHPQPTLLSLPGRAIGWLGLMTYAIYVWHEPLIVSFARHTAQAQNMGEAYVQLALSMIPIMLVAFVMWKYIEVPFERMKHFARIVRADTTPRR
ncbi:acyltransferase family protein [Roseixanthobacter liquoris]|uniref:acyltransferase family protein n=1 Tax=Roseixanthobacter liquoris TaxID=3119921 RepID=UPI003729ABF6